MKKYIISLVMLAGLAQASYALVGGPTFVVPQKMTSMSVYGSQFNSTLNSSEGSALDQPMTSNRMSLLCRYGVFNNMDIGAQIGTANLDMSELGGGYSDFSADWDLSWGAALRAGFPGGTEHFQVTAGLSYFGFQPSGTTANDSKSISSRYMWQELTPALTAGYRWANFIPYVGLTKPFLFGEKDTAVSFNGVEFPRAGGTSTYSDSKQSVRALFGLEWKFPDGYSVTGEAGSSSDGDWTLSLGLTQMMR